MPFLIRTLINAAALWVATRIVSGIEAPSAWLPFLAVAFVFGIVNVFLGRLVKIVTFPLILVTFGLFLLVVNALMLMVTSALAGSLGLGFHVAGFWPAFWGALVVSIVSTILTVVIAEPRRI